MKNFFLQFVPPTIIILATENNVNSSLGIDACAVSGEEYCTCYGDNPHDNKVYLFHRVIPFQ